MRYYTLVINIYIYTYVYGHDPFISAVPINDGHFRQWCLATQGKLVGKSKT